MADAARSADHERFMAAAIRLGAGALGATWPNPAVGAIVVRDGIVVGRGRTGVGGRPHGETVALGAAGAAARGATLYVSLEPCAHHGKTPPCAEAIIAAGISRVVAAAEDPDPRVSGRGFAQLRQAGIDVVAGVLSGEARRHHAGHVSRCSQGRPYVLLKLAVSADDAIGRRGEAAVPITGEPARRFVQAMRSRFDAIMVGRGTVESDDPYLTTRLPGLEGRSPVRIILDSAGRLSGERRIFDVRSSPTWVLTAAGPEQETGPCRRINVPREGAGLDLRAALIRLGAEGITRILVEGGAQVARSLLESDLVDDVVLFRSPAELGGNLVPVLAGLPLSTVEDSDRYRRTEARTFGADRMTRYSRAR